MKRLIVVCCLLFLVGCLPKEYKGMKDGLYANFSTNKGEILVELYFEDTPMTVANFMSLAEGTNTSVSDSLRGNKYYNGIRFHRVVKNFVIQAGDKTETGRGGPGYIFGDEFPKYSDGKLKYSHDDAGILSMANPGKNSNGSQFFITHRPLTYLDGKHSVFGKTTINSTQMNALKTKYSDTANLQKAVDSLRMAVVNSIEPFDTILGIDFIAVGSKARSFDAADVFDEGLKKFRLAAKDRLLNAKKEEEERYAKYLKDRDANLTAKGFDSEKATASGLKVKKIKPTKGMKVPEDKLVRSHFTLYTADGNKIQSTLDGGSPFVFRLDDTKNPMIPGFKEGVLQLREKEKALIYIPYEIGFGAKKYGPFPAKSDLIFEIEILEIGK